MNTCDVAMFIVLMSFNDMYVFVYTDFQCLSTSSAKNNNHLSCRYLKLSGLTIDFIFGLNYRNTNICTRILLNNCYKTFSQLNFIFFYSMTNKLLANFPIIFIVDSNLRG